jgi:hypothetical protein
MSDEQKAKRAGLKSGPALLEALLAVRSSLFALRFLLRAFPAWDGDLLGARERELARRRFLGDRAARADGRAAADDDRGD